MYSFKVDEGRAGVGVGGGGGECVAAVFGFMTTSSGIRMTTECVVMLYKCVSVCQYIFCVCLRMLGVSHIWTSGLLNIKYTQA